MHSSISVMAAHCALKEILLFFIPLTTSRLFRRDTVAGTSVS